MILNTATNQDALFTSIYNENQSKLYRFCLARLHGDTHVAEDCVQNAFTVFYRRLKDGEHFDNPMAFIYRTADNLIKKKYRETKTELKHVIPIDSVESTASYDRVFNISDTFDFDNCAESLLSDFEEDEQTIYTLRYVENLSIDEIAERLEISTPAATMRLFRVRTKIKTCVKDIMKNYGEGG